MRLRALVLCFGIGLASLSHALLIDDFNDGSLAHAVNGGAEAFALTSATCLGGDRATYIDQTTFLGNRYSILDISAGAFSIDDSIGTDSISSVGYGVNSVFGGGGFGIDPSSNFNLTGNQNIQIDFQANDQPLTVYVGFFDGSGSDFIIYQKAVAGGQFSPFSVTLTPADTVASVGSLNWGAVDQIRFDFQTSNAGDFAIDRLSAVPEPASLAVIGLGLAALARRRRK